MSADHALILVLVLGAAVFFLVYSGGLHAGYSVSGNIGPSVPTGIQT